MSRVRVRQAEAILKIAPRGTERRPRPEGLNRLPHIVEAFRDLASYTSRGGVALPTRCFPAEPYFFASPRDPKCKINLTAILAAILACYSRILPPSGGSFLCLCAFKGEEDRDPGKKDREKNGKISGQVATSAYPYLLFPFFSLFALSFFPAIVASSHSRIFLARLVPRWYRRTRGLLSSSSSSTSFPLFFHFLPSVRDDSILFRLINEDDAKTCTRIRCPFLPNPVPFL